MIDENYKGLQEAYNSIYEALNDQSELDNLRKASAQAMMAGPSKEAQALMSDRTKRMLGADKLRAGIAGQERVQRMMSGTPEPTSTPKPTASPAPTSTTVPTPKPQIKPGDFGTTMGPGPTFRGGPVPPPIAKQTPQTSVPDRSSDYQRAWDNRNNPLAKGQIRNTWNKMSPEEKAAAKEWAKANNKNWQEMGLPESVNLYDQVLEILLDEGYTEQESNQIMVELVNEAAWNDFLKAVQSRTGIGKPGVGPGQVAKNVLRAGISDILGTSIGAGSAPSASAPVKAPTVRTQSPAPIVRTSTAKIRTAPKGANIAPDPWKGGTTGNKINDITQKPTAKPTTTRALTGSSGPNVRGALPSSSSSARGGAITPTAKPGSVTPAAKPVSGKPVSTRIQPVTVREIPSSSKGLPGSNVRGLLPQGVRNVLPDPWKQASDTVSGARNLWSRVQQATKPQAQLKPTQTNVRGLLPAAKPTTATQAAKPTAAKPTTATQAAKPATSVRSQQFQDVQRLNRMTGGGLMGELPRAKPASKPAPKPTGVDKLVPKPAKAAKPAAKPQTPGGGSKILQGLGTLASLRNLTPFGVAAAVMAPRPTADGTLTAAMKRGDVAPPAPKLPAPAKPAAAKPAPKPAAKPAPKPAAKPAAKSVAKPASKPVSKPAAKPAAPVDPDLQKYNELRKTDLVKAKELGTKIWLRKYGIPGSDYA